MDPELPKRDAVPALDSFLHNMLSYDSHPDLHLLLKCNVLAQDPFCLALIRAGGYFLSYFYDFPVDHHLFLIP